MILHHVCKQGQPDSVYSKYPFVPVPQQLAHFCNLKTSDFCHISLSQILSFTNKCRYLSVIGIESTKLITW
jgi:hypothetical protein